MKYTIQTILILAACALTSVAWAQEPGNHEALTKEGVADLTKSEYSPYAGRDLCRLGSVGQFRWHL